MLITHKDITHMCSQTAYAYKYFDKEVELCDNLDNKIIEMINFIKIIVFIIVKIVNFWILLYILPKRIH